MDQHYALRWSKHHENLSDGFTSYFKRGLMCDVTITVGPRQKLKAHQVILSACSPYFESIFTENTHQNVTVMMVNVDHEILKAIIEYIYKGEVNIAQELLPEFLKTAAHFQVKGLVDPENIGQNADYDKHLPSSASPPISKSQYDNDCKKPYMEQKKSHHEERFEEHESDLMQRDYDLTNDNGHRMKLSSILTDPVKKRRKDSSICDNTLPLKRIHLRSPESNLSDASSQSSYKISPLPKSNPNDVDGEEKRKSPNANPLQQPSIKQEEPSDVAGSPQVHLSTPPMYTHTPGPPQAQFPGHDDILNSVGLHPNHPNHHEPENEQPIPHLEPGNEIDGSKAWHMRLTFERLSGGCNLHRCKLCGKVVTHIRNHYHVHYPGRFECPLCRATYTRSDNLRTHCKFKHPMFNPDTKKFENLMNPFAQQTAAIAAIAAANSFSAAASLSSVVQSHNEAMKPE